MKPFDLKAALSGEPVMDPDGDIYVCTGKFNSDMKSMQLRHVTDEFWTAWCSFDGVKNQQQLHMAPKKVKKTVYVTLLPNGQAWWCENEGPDHSPREIDHFSREIEVEE